MKLIKRNLILSHVRLKVQLACVLLFLSPASWANNDGNFGIGTLSASKVVAENTVLYGAAGVIQEAYAGKMATIGVARKAESGITWKTAYFLYNPDTADGGSNYDHRARVSLNYKFAYQGWNLAPRLRVEYRWGDILEGFRVRPRLEISRPFAMGKMPVIPYLDLETFYDVRVETITLSLWTIGAKAVLSKRLILNAGYFNVFKHDDNTRVDGPTASLHIRF